MKLRQAMPDLIGESTWLNGRVNKFDLVGNPTIIHFWSVSCHTCKEVMPNLNALRKKYAHDLNVVAVHMPRSANDLDISTINSVANAHQMTQPIFVDNDLKLTNEFGNQHVPSYYLFDKEGKLRHVQAGGGGMALLEMRLKRVLQEVNRSSR